MFKRIFDLTFSLMALIVFLPLFFFIFILMKLLEPRNKVLYWSKRVGKNNQIFLMPKFRTMKPDTPQLATHLLTDAENHITFMGKWLRKTSLDELPQLWSILIGDMAVVGPRPALFNQDDLIQLRTKKEIHLLKPGLTGWAQINGRDELSIKEKVDYDFYYKDHASLSFDCKIILLTFFRVFRLSDIKH